MDFATTHPGQRLRPSTSADAAACAPGHSRAIARLKTLILGPTWKRSSIRPDKITPLSPTARLFLSGSSSIGLFCRTAMPGLSWLQPYLKGANPGRPTSASPTRWASPHALRPQVTIAGTRHPGAFYRGLLDQALDGIRRRHPDTSNDGPSGARQCRAPEPPHVRVRPCASGRHVLWRSRSAAVVR